MSVSSRKENIMPNEYYGVDLSKLSEDEKADVSQRLHELQETCMRLEGEGKIGIVYGYHGCVESLKEEGFDVELTYW
jgi:hypothetical protein